MLPDELLHLEETEPMSDLRPVSDSLTVVGRVPSWRQAAQWCSTFLPGQWYFKDTGCTWSCGRRTHWFCPPEALAAIVHARETVQRLGCEPGWSVGSCARSVVDLLPRPPYPFKAIERVIPRNGPGYLACLPGTYPFVRHWDVSAYYFSILSKLPSLWPICTAPGRLVWATWKAGEENRWRDILGVIAGDKPVRNALVGVMAGRAKGTRFYHAGQVREWKGTPGPYRAAAIVVWRTGWEVTATQADALEAVYAATDSVIVPSGAIPEVWTALGFSVKLEHEGDCEICHPGVYRVGEHATGWYRRGSRLQERRPREQWQRGESYAGWLTIAA